VVLGLIAVGVAIVVLSSPVNAARSLPGKVWRTLVGVVDVLLDILALSWPAATVLVLSLLLGVQVVAVGVLPLPKASYSAVVAASLIVVSTCPASAVMARRRRRPWRPG
jgi:uncharacterized membrane protein HdeD (DUF308 family)